MEFLKSFFIIVGLSFFCACSSTRPIIKLSANNPIICFDRSACFGACPVYTLTIRGDGTAEYIGKSNVDRIGVYNARIDETSIFQLINEFDSVRFFALKDVYDAEVTDVATRTLRYTLNDSTKTVTDRFSPPPGLRDLEQSIDSVADLLVWKKISD